MPTYEITSPDGRKFEVTAPEGTTQEEILARVQSQSVAPQAVAPERESRSLRAGLAGASRGVLQTMDLPAFAASALINPVREQLGMEPTVNLQPFQRLGALAGLGTLQPGTDPERRAAFAGEMLGATLVPGAGMASRAQAPARALGVEGAALLGSIGGGILGREVGDEAGEMLGVLAGGMAPMAAPGAARRFVSPYGAEHLRPTMEAATRQGVPVTAGQAMRGSFLEKSSATLPGGQRAAETFAERQSARFGARVDELQRSLSVREPSSEAAGRAISRGMDEWITAFRRHGNELYGLVGRHITADTPVILARTKALTEDMITDERFSKILDSPLLRQMGQALEEGSEVSYETARAIRSRIGERLSSPALMADASTAQYKRLYGALTDDIEDVVTTAGPEAERVYGMANRYWRAGMQRIEDFLEPIHKQNLPEKAYTAAMAGANEGASRLRAIKKSLSPEQWNVLVGTTLRRLGRTRPSDRITGTIMDEATDFSPETFLTNLERMSVQARRVLFSGQRYRGLERNMDDLINVAQGIRAQRQTAFNPSGTAGGLANIGWLSALPFINPMQTARLAGGVAGNALLQRALQSPSTLQYLANPTQFSPAIAPQMTRTLMASHQ